MTMTAEQFHERIRRILDPLGGDLTDLYAEQIAELMQRQQDMALRLAERATRKQGRLPG